MSPNSHTVEVEDLVKIYPRDIKAVNGISFSVGNGEFFGLLGPNGAGKSTTLKIMGTLLRKTTGRVVVAGYDIDKHSMDVRRSIGFAMQEVGLDDLSTGRDFLITQGLLYDLPRSKSKQRAEELLEVVGLTEAATRKVGTYSGGMRRRLDLIGALMHSPPLLFLDEPTTGLDPQSRLAIWNHLEQLNRQGITIILTTQIMEEADRLCKRIAIIDQGAIVAQGTSKELKADFGGDVVTLAVGTEEHGGLAEKAKGLLAGREYVSEVVVNGVELTVTVRNGNAVVADVVSVLGVNKIPITNLAVSSPTLDDVFLKHTGHTIRSDSTGGDEMNQAMKAMMGVNQRR